MKQQQKQLLDEWQPVKKPAVSERAMPMPNEVTSHGLRLILLQNHQPTA